MAQPLPVSLMAPLSTFIAQHLGLSFVPQRWPDLERGLASAASDFTLPDAEACARWLLHAPLTRAHLETLASHLTIGETYFFREKPTLDLLTQKILPDLIRSRRGTNQRLRIWSAACCTGEEPYTLAMLLHQLLPDLADWHITILATDINPHFLRKAAAGVYGSWSFRETTPPIRDVYFRPAKNGRWKIIPEIQKLVTFASLNLAQDPFPSLDSNTTAMDMILCRNVLMYFTAEQVRKVAGQLHASVVEGGWLVVSPSEVSSAWFPEFATRNFPGAILYQKDGTAKRPRPLESRAVEPIRPLPSPALPAWTPPSPTPVVTIEKTTLPSPASPPPPAVPPAAPSPVATARDLYAQGRYEEAAKLLLASLETHSPDACTFSLLARSLANQGRLDDALTWCDRWVAADKVEADAHYLRAVVLIEQGITDSARQSLQSAIYLRPDFVLAHFALGNLARGRGRNSEANKHLANALHLLQRHEVGELLPESDGLTAGRLREMISGLMSMTSTP